MGSNYQDVLDQMQAFGLKPKSGRLVVGKMQRCPVEEDSEERGWYILHEVTTNDGKPAWIGAYGIWRGMDNNAQKIELNTDDFSDEQKSAFKKRMADDKKAAEAYQKKRAEDAALEAIRLWNSLEFATEHEYLTRKCVLAHGIKINEDGALVLPVRDANDRIHGVQFIFDKAQQKAQIEKNKGRDKAFWPFGVVKKAHFHMIGAARPLMLIAEGYATASSLHEATGYPVAVAFDAGNLVSVAAALRKKYPRSNLLICADDDAFSHCKVCQQPINVNDGVICPQCSEPHGKQNAGVKYAELAALDVNGRVVRPVFPDTDARFDHYRRNQGKLTDFNDLHQQTSLVTVQQQIEAAIARAGWSAPTPAGAVQTQGGGEGKKPALKPIDDYDHAIERYSLVYGMGGMLFDGQEHMRIALNDFKQACIHSDIPKRWQESKERRIVRPEEVGFDPSENDPEITCNTWDGWPTTAKAGRCDRLLELLQYMCAEENNSHAVYDWILKWLAYPIQHPGAKMKTTIVIHGPQGTGKNLFFDCILAIYGKYGRIIDQSAIEDKFNDVFAGKLFMLADEVVARSDLYHVKNKLKGLITGDRIRINPKNMAAYEEANHVNMVFLSNERMPVVLEQDDRRHQVIWTPAKLSPEFYQEIADEIKEGGIAALHDHLLNLPLGEFNPHTKPIMTEAKTDLINLGKDNVLRFYDEWIAGELDGIELLPVLSADLYDLYKHWCGLQGVRATPLNYAIDKISKREGAAKDKKRYLLGSIEKQAHFIFPPKHIEMNPGNSQSGWLGSCVEKFRTQCDIYKGNAYD